ncbi:hypothetical protein J6590_044309 [Homalodisca vitripennis]|nr:hypothetical protein J6590_044309 [Homalodisca vitripennis]
MDLATTLNYIDFVVTLLIPSSLIVLLITLLLVFQQLNTVSVLTCGPLDVSGNHTQLHRLRGHATHPLLNSTLFVCLLVDHWMDLATTLNYIHFVVTLLIPSSLIVLLTLFFLCFSNSSLLVCSLVDHWMDLASKLNYIHFVVMLPIFFCQIVLLITLFLVFQQLITVSVLTCGPLDGSGIQTQLYPLRGHATHLLLSDSPPHHSFSCVSATHHC